MYWGKPWAYFFKKYVLIVIEASLYDGIPVETVSCYYRDLHSKVADSRSWLTRAIDSVVCMDNRNIFIDFSTITVNKKLRDRQRGVSSNRKCTFSTSVSWVIWYIVGSVDTCLILYCQADNQPYTPKHPHITECSASFSLSAKIRVEFGVKGINGGFAYEVLARSYSGSC